MPALPPSTERSYAEFSSAMTRLNKCDPSVPRRATFEYADVDGERGFDGAESVDTRYFRIHEMDPLLCQVALA